MSIYLRNSESAQSALHGFGYSLMKIDEALDIYEGQKEVTNKAAHRVGLLNEVLGAVATFFSEGASMEEEVLRQANDQLKEELKRRLEKEKREKEEKEKCSQGGAPCPDRPAPVSSSSQ